MPKRKPKVTPRPGGVRTAAGCHDPPAQGGGGRIEGVNKRYDLFKKLLKEETYNI